MRTPPGLILISVFVALASLASCGGDSAGEPACADPTLSSCVGACVDLQTDLANCGACGTACGLGEFCSGAVCRPFCLGGLTDCDGTCRDPATDRGHCGGCGQACDPGNVCAEGSCALSCPTHLTTCGDVCTNLAVDPARCGACDTPCTLANATPACAAGGCLIAACDANFCDSDANAANGCELAITPATDANHCGGCNRVCSSGVCETGGCALRVFVTSNEVPPDFGGLAGADAICQGRATSASLGGTWKAWIADPTGSPSTRFTQGTRSYRRIDGELVAADYAELTSGMLEHGIDMTEAGIVVVSVDAWSNVAFNGILSSSAIGSHCNGWTVNTGLGGRVGMIGEDGPLWSDAGVTDCGQVRRLYCVEQ